MPYRDPGKAREQDRERYRRLTKERLASGMCPKCGREPFPPDRRLCRSCGEKKRKAERARYARAKDEGRLYGGRDPKVRRRIGRERSRKRFRAHRAAGLCTRCGHRSPVQGGATCQACRDARQRAEREQYAARRAEGQCGRCGGSALEGASRCGSCATLEAGRYPRKNAAGRRRYAQRRERWRCTDCGQPSQGGGAVRAVRAPVLGALGPTSRPSDPFAAVHGDRDRHGRGPRDLGQLGGGGHVHGLRSAVARTGGNHNFGYVTDGDFYGAVNAVCAGSPGVRTA